MSEFYTRAQGNQGEVTRMGSKASGVRATVESRASVVRTRMFTEETAVSGHGTNIEITDKHGNQTGIHLYLDTDTLALASRQGDDEVERAIAAVNNAVDNLDEMVGEFITEQRKKEA